MLKDERPAPVRRALPVDRLHALVAGEADAGAGPRRPGTRPCGSRDGRAGMDGPCRARETPAASPCPGWPSPACMEETGRAAMPAPLLTTLQVTAVLAAAAVPPRGPGRDLPRASAATLACHDGSGAGPYCRARERQAQRRGALCAGRAQVRTASWCLRRAGRPGPLLGGRRRRGVTVRRQTRSST
jgi:hypothetical protein